MPQDTVRQFLDFEKPIKDLIEEIELTKERSEKQRLICRTRCNNWSKK